MNEHETVADIIAEMRGIRVREFQDFADRLEAAYKRDHEYPKAQSLDADKLTGKNISGLVTDLRQIAKYHYARGNIVQGQFARVMADRIEAAHRREITILLDTLAEVVASIEVRFPVIEYALDRKPYLDAKKILEQYKEEAK